MKLTNPMAMCIAVVVLFFSSNVLAAEVAVKKSFEQAASQDINCLNNSFHTQETARRGCCSHHGGVCGCSGGRQICCDNSFSPSCTCNKPDVPSPGV